MTSSRIAKPLAARWRYALRQTGAHACRHLKVWRHGGTVRQGRGGTLTEQRQTTDSKTQLAYLHAVVLDPERYPHPETASYVPSGAPSRATAGQPCAQARLLGPARRRPSCSQPVGAATAAGVAGRPRPG